LVKNLVDHPDAVVVTMTEEGAKMVLAIQVDPSDVGKVVGKQGRIIKALRTLVVTIGARLTKQVILELAH